MSKLNARFHASSCGLVGTSPTLSLSHKDSPFAILTKWAKTEKTTGRIRIRGRTQGLHIVTTSAPPLSLLMGKRSQLTYLLPTPTTLCREPAATYPTPHPSYPTPPNPNQPHTPPASQPPTTTQPRLGSGKARVKTLIGCHS